MVAASKLRTGFGIEVLARFGGTSRCAQLQTRHRVGRRDQFSQDRHNSAWTPVAYRTQMSNRTFSIAHKLDGKPLRLDREQFIAGKALITAASGGGKSVALRKTLEQCGRIAQTIVLDWEG